jgi:hypothetical protein
MVAVAASIITPHMADYYKFGLLNFFMTPPRVDYSMVAAFS